MKSLQLSEHFNLSEFERSATADRLHIDNTCPSTLIPQLSTLCKTILEPLRQHFGEPVIISSGYRSPTLNIKVGGVYASQHTLGEAADIVPLPPAGSSPSLSSKLSPLSSKPSALSSWFEWLRSNTDFDQLILEHDSKGSYWIHVSCRRNLDKNRHQVFYDLKKK